MNKKVFTAIIFLLVTLFILGINIKPVSAITCGDLDGAYLYSNESNPIYLGFFGNSLASQSINNQFGTYGNQFSSLSVRNQFGSYGSQFGTYSANNDFTLYPPRIYKYGNIIGYLTTNTLRAGGVSLAEIDTYCSFYASVPYTSIVCTYTISPTISSLNSLGNTGFIAVTTSSGCSWTATSNASWITITAGSAGTGNGTVSYSVSANTSTSSRSGTATIAGQTFTVNQSGVSCSYSISSASKSFTSSGNTESLGVIAASGCAWTASSNASWITITSGSSGSGNGTVFYSISANSGTGTRSGTLTIGGQTFTVTQAGFISCTYTISPTSSLFSTEGTGGVTVTTSSSSCSWTASSDNSWITITSGSSGSGNGTVGYSAAANSGLTRTGTITIGGQTFTVTQASSNPYLDTVQKIFIGYYQRPADPAGLIYWAGRLASNGGNLAEIIEAFANSAESQALYGAINSTSIGNVLEEIYQSLLGRPADAGGRDYYVAGFNTGRFTAATIMLNLIDGIGPTGVDRTTFDNKLAAANLFTRTIDPDLDGSNFQVTYAGDGDVIAARNFLALNATSVKVPTQAETTAYIRTNIANPDDQILSIAGMVLIPAGSFQMGDAIDGMSGAMPVHTVTVSAFYLDKYEVTKALWDEVYTWAMAQGYSFENVGAGTATNHPVQTVSWYDVVKWLNARSEKEGRTPVYYTDVAQTTIHKTGQVNVTNGMAKWTANGYRLPTEAEWEYAARAGTTTRFYTGNCISADQANYDGRSPEIGCSAGQYRGATTAVGSFAANPWGLHDMTGNAWEWTWDWYGGYSSSAVTNPKGLDSGSDRVVRGGNWFSPASFLRSAYGSSVPPSSSFFYTGFRSALSQP